MDAAVGVVASGAGQSGLGDGDLVQGGVDLAVARAAEAMAGVVAGGHGLRGGPVPARVGRSGAKAAGAGGLADELGGGPWAATRDLEQRGRQAGDELPDAAVEFARTGVELAGALEQLARKLGDEPVEIAQLVKVSRTGFDGDGVCGFLNCIGECVGLELWCV